MIVGHSIYNDFFHVTVKPYSSEIEEWLNANVVHGKWWIAGKQQFQTFVCIENKIDYMWFVLRWA